MIQQYIKERPEYISNDTVITIDEIIDHLEDDPSYINRIEDTIIPVLIWYFPDRFLHSGVKLTKDMCRMLVESSPRLILYLASSTPELQMLAVCKNPSLANRIKNPCEDLLAYLTIMA